MQALGNDFIIIDNRQQQLIIDINTIQRMADRRKGVGCDQLVIIENTNKADVFMQIFNNDGSEVGACGNVTRCVAKLLGGNVKIETKAGILHCRSERSEEFLLQSAQSADRKILHCVQDDSYIAVDMGQPKFYNIPLAGNPVGVDIGNPHCVFFVEDVAAIDLEQEGPKFETHELFPNHTNVEFAQVIDNQTVRMRVWERGVGVTPACGTGACAVAVAAHKLGKTGSSVNVILDGGNLHIEVGKTLKMSGPANYVFEGTYYV